ncbi:MAG: lipA [Cellvibrio sp.]|nr:lipA [Cellvibrio sp.]
MSDLPPVSTFVPELQPVKRTERYKQGEKLRDADKVERIPVKVIASDRPDLQRKPDWIRVRIPASPEVERIKSILRFGRMF